MNNAPYILLLYVSLWYPLLRITKLIDFITVERLILFAYLTRMDSVSLAA